MKPILNIENLTKIYGNVPSQTKALNGITFQVMPGEFLGIMGSSGSGKSSRVNAVAEVLLFAICTFAIMVTAQTWFVHDVLNVP